jgi:hypothetical protein
MEYAKHSLHSVWLPGSEAICFEQAVDLGICTKRSHAHLIERDKPTFMKLQENIKRKRLHERTNIHLYNNRNNYNLEELMNLCQTKYKDIYNDCKDLWQYNDEWIALAAFELKCCFSEWDFVLKSPYPYRDTHWGMVVYRCEDFQKKETGLPKIEELLMQTKMGRRDIHLNRVLKAYAHANALASEFCVQQDIPDCTNRINTIISEVFQ